MRRFFLTPVLAFALLLAAAALTHAQSPPANDNFADRQVLPSETTVVTSGTTVGATQQAFEKLNGAGSPAGDDLNQTKTVWYQWTPPVSGTLIASILDFTVGTQAYLAVFEGSSVPTLSQLIAQGYPYVDYIDYGPPPFHVTGGQEYNLSLGNTTDPGSFTLKLSLIPDQPTVTLSTPQAIAIRSSGQKGEFRFTLSTPAAVPLTLSYEVSGTAQAGIDYKRLRGTVVVPVGASTAVVYVKPLAKGSNESGSPLKVKLTLEAGAGYSLGSPATATVRIREHD